MRGTTRYTTESIIARFIKLNGNKYDYSKVKYIDHYTPVCIICPIHGEFLQKPISHLQGKGCKKCNINHTLTTDEFIMKADKKHNYKYDYSNVIYVRGVDKVNIICKKHGIFKQQASKHLEGRGCPICSHNNALLNRNKVFLYVLYDEKYNISKIGISKNVKSRKNKIELELRYNIKQEYCIANFGHNETNIHRILKEHRINHPIPHAGESEWFNLTPNEIIEHIKTLQRLENVNDGNKQLILLDGIPFLIKDESLRWKRVVINNNIENYEIIDSFNDDYLNLMLDDINEQLLKGVLRNEIILNIPIEIKMVKIGKKVITL